MFYFVQELNNASVLTCTENKTTGPQQTSPVVSKNITEVKFSRSETERQGTELKNKPYDIGVVKITSDEIAVLSDNTSLARDRVADGSVLHILRTISPNLTDGEIDTLLQVLNNSANLDSLEAIILNTEAELYDRTDTMFSEENDNSQDNDDDVPGHDTSEESNTEKDMPETITLPGKDVNGAALNETTDKPPELSDKLKTELKTYALLWKIKHNTVNATIMTEILKSANKIDKEQIQVLQVLCYGQSFFIYNLDNIMHITDMMRNRLLFIKQALNDVHLYEQIETICNLMNEPITLTK